MTLERYISEKVFDSRRIAHQKSHFFFQIALQKLSNPESFLILIGESALGKSHSPIPQDLLWTLNSRTTTEADLSCFSHQFIFALSVAISVLLGALLISRH